MENDAGRVTAYRIARRNFIAASEAAGGDAISRVHPARGPDGKPLFCDSVALGPRDASKAVLLVAGEDGAVTALLRKKIALPERARLVAVHTLDPFLHAWGRTGEPADWPERTLASIAGEDLSRVTNLVVLDLSENTEQAALKKALPKGDVTVRSVQPEHAEQAFRAAIAAL